MNNNYYMQKALNLAEKGTGRVSPNPMVGALIVKNDKIIAKGYHIKFGGPHAEVNAFSNLKESAKGAVLFVTLEPCCHYGKTPPCTDAIIKSGIKKVIIGMKDPNPLVSGKGMAILKKNKINVIIENLNGKVEEFYYPFTKYITTGYPYVTLKMAMTLDGKIASRSGDSKWITNNKSRILVHKERSKTDAILTGVETVIKDNPKLTPYMLKNKTHSPLRIVLDPNLRIPEKSNILHDNIKTIIITSKRSFSKKDKISSENTEIVAIPAKLIKGHNVFNLNKLLAVIGKLGITSLLIEGGGNTAYTFLDQKLVDKVMFFIAPKIIGGKDALTPVEGEGIKLISDAVRIKNVSIKNIDSDLLIIGYPNVPDKTK